MVLELDLKVNHKIFLFCLSKRIEINDTFGRYTPLVIQNLSKEDSTNQCEFKLKPKDLMIYASYLYNLC